MKNTVLFDLDGTLLPMKFEQFMKYYFYSISEYFKDSINQEELINAINESTVHTVKTNDGRSNEEIFVEHFNKITNLNDEFSMEKFYSYYDSSFELCKKATWQDENIIKAVHILKEKGYKVAIATNPLLPLRANHSRIRWAGFEPSDFDYISSFEGNKFCKPNLDFYKEVLEFVDSTPEESYMIGNDTSEDLVASQLGIETYLINDCILDKKEKGYKPDLEGSYIEFLEFVKVLPSIIKT